MYVQTHEDDESIDSALLKCCSGIVILQRLVKIGDGDSLLTQCMIFFGWNRMPRIDDQALAYGPGMCFGSSEPVTFCLSN